MRHVASVVYGKWHAQVKCSWPEARRDGILLRTYGKLILDTPLTGVPKEPAGLKIFASPSGGTNQAEVRLPNSPNGSLIAACREAPGIARNI